MTTTIASNHTPAQIRFSDIPSSFEINVAGVDADDTVEVDLEDLLDDPTELCTLLENEGAARSYWMMVALAYAKQHKPDRAIELLHRGLAVTARAAPREKLSMLTCLCWLFLWKSREAPRMAPRMYPPHQPQSEPCLTIRRDNRGYPSVRSQDQRLLPRVCDDDPQ
jgi:RNA polymerase-associated protein CTR9